jgi:hypothetical protein
MFVPGDRAQQRLLHQVVRPIDVSAQRHGEGAQARDNAKHRLT